MLTKRKKIKNNDKILFYYHFVYGKLQIEKQELKLKPNIPYNNKEYIYQINDWIVEYHYFNGVNHCYSQGLRFIEEFYPNRKPNESYYLDKNDKTQGKHIFYYTNLNVNCTIFRKDSLDEGEEIFYYRNGMIESHGFYKNDLKHGEFKDFYIDGTLKKHVFYENDLIVGKYESFWNNGQLGTLSFFKNGKYHGHHFKYNKDGNVKVHEYYSDGEIEYTIK